MSALDRARDAAASVTDPELPPLTIDDLGILRDVRITDGVVEVANTPTYSGCPAMREIGADIAAGFQTAVTEVLADRAAHAMAMMAGQASLLVVAGGVSANLAVRAALEKTAAARGFRLAAAPIRLCTDNAVMVAWAGVERLRHGLVSTIDFAPRPRWPLESLAG